MTATVQVLCQYGFEELKLVRLVAHVFELNRAIGASAREVRLPVRRAAAQAFLERGEVY